MTPPSRAASTGHAAAVPGTGVSVRGVLVMVAAVLLGIFLLAPFSWLLLTSFMIDAEVLSVPPHWIPEQITLANYLFYLNPTGQQAMQAGNAFTTLPRSLLNSVIIAVLVVFTNLAFGVPAAYSFARLRFAGSSSLMVLYLVSRMVPSLAIMIPIYIFFAKVQLLDTIWAPAIAHITITLPFTIWILKGYLQTIPQELEDAARVDRCTRLQAIMRVLLPVSAPGLVAAGMFAFMTSWGEFLLSAALTRTIASTPMTIIIANLAVDLYVSRTLVTAGVIISLATPVLLALAFQRVIVQGLVSGSVKG